MNSGPLTIIALNKTYFVEELRALGHTVYTASVPANQSLRYTEMTSSRRFDVAFEEGIAIERLLEKFPETPSIDCLVYYDDSNPNLYVSGLERSIVPTLFYSVDAHIHHRWHPVLGGLFDKVLVAQKDYISHFKEYNQEVFWFPLWTGRVVEPALQKTIDVCFRGNIDPKFRPKRVEFLKRLAALVPVDFCEGSYVDSFSRAKIIINEALSGDVNFRVFEAMACGGMLLTARVGNGLSDLFMEGEDLVTYEEWNEQDAADKIRYYLSHEEERARIAASGRRKILAGHTVEIRAKQFEQHLRVLQRTSRPCLNYAASCEELLQASLLLGRFSNEIKNKIHQAHNHLIKSASRKERCDGRLISTYIVLRVMQEERGMAEGALDLARYLFGAYPDQHVFLFAIIDSLLKLGRKADALTLATSMSSEPEAVLAHATQELQRLKESSATLQAVMAKY